MRKLLSLIILLNVTLFTLLSCDKPFERIGIENYHKANSNSSLSLELLPSDDFLEIFDYIDGDYYYICRETPISLGDEQEIMYLIYEEENYKLAKEYALQNLLLSKDNRYFYNGYEFIENTCRKREGMNTDIVNDEYPNLFNMLAFNDEKNTMIFMGFNMPKKLVTPEIEQLLTFEDMDAFLREYFSFYNFDA